MRSGWVRAIEPVGVWRGCGGSGVGAGAFDAGGSFAIGGRPGLGAVFFFTETAHTEIYTGYLHVAVPI